MSWLIVSASDLCADERHCALSIDDRLISGCLGLTLRALNNDSARCANYAGRTRPTQVPARLDGGH